MPVKFDKQGNTGYRKEELLRKFKDRHRKNKALLRTIIIWTEIQPKG